MPVITVHKKERVVPGVYARSTRLIPVKAIWVKQIDRILVDHGVGKDQMMMMIMMILMKLIFVATRPMLPTAKVVETFDQVRCLAVNLLEWKKQTEKLEAELKGGSIASSRRGSASIESPNDPKRRKLL